MGAFEIPPADDRVRVTSVEVLSDNWYVLRKVGFEIRLSDGRTTLQHREAYDRGNGAAVLLYDPDRATVILTRQFRLPAYVNGHPGGWMIEVPAGLLDGSDAEQAVRREAEEEVGIRVGEVRRVFDTFMSPGSVTERLVLFAAPYSPASRADDGGGLDAEGEDIEVIECPFAEAIAMMDAGEIVDAKTIMLLQWAKLHGVV